MISPTLACVDYLNIGQDVCAMDAAQADLFHIDIMDGHYVPNLCLNFDMVGAIRRVSNTPMDVHLMVSNPMDYVDVMARHGIEYACAHPDACGDVDAFLDALGQRGIKAGLALSPDVDVEVVLPWMDRVDYLLLLFVRPGFAGQAFMPQVLSKLERLHALRTQRQLRCRLFCDGGISWDNAGDVLVAGGDVLVAGAFTVFDGALPLQEACTRLKQMTQAPRAATL